MWFARLCLLLVLVTLTYCDIQNKGWWKHAIFYQIYPRSFMDSDGDGIGDLNGITSKLDHIAEAGVSAIWLSPIYSSPMIDFGYDISDFTEIHPVFGTKADFRRLVARAKELNLKIILDFVPNHSSDKHVWFQKSISGQDKYTDYYIWRDGKNNDSVVPPNNWRSVFGGPAWTYSEQRKKWYLHQFLKQQPDLNFENPDVRAEMEEVVKYWLREGIDGVRIDSVAFFYENSKLYDEPRSYTPGVPPEDHEYLQHIYTMDDPRTYELIQTWRDIMDAYSASNNEDEKVMMTEAYVSTQNAIKYYEYGAQIPFNFKFVINANRNSTPVDIQKLIYEWVSNIPNFATPNWVAGNHDNGRVGSRFPGRVDQMNMLVMLLPGIAVTYNGEEIGMVDNKDATGGDFRDVARTPFQWDTTKNAGFSKGNSTWLPINKDFQEVNLASERAANESHYKVYLALSRLRKVSSAIRDGDHRTVVLNDNRVLGVLRESDSESVIVLINFLNDKSQMVDLSDYITQRGRTIVEIASVGSSVKAGTVVDPTRVTLPPKASLVLRSS